jgi:chorismate mutase
MSDHLEQLEDYRTSIDLLDDAIVKLLAERMRVVKKIGTLKKQHQMPSLQPERFQKVLDSKVALAEQSGLEAEFVASIYELMHTHAVKAEDSV